MMIGTLAITGVGIPLSYDLFGMPIGFAGFVSKDAIIESAWGGGSMYGFWLLVAAAAMTGLKRAVARMLFPIVCSIGIRAPHAIGSIW